MIGLGVTESATEAHLDRIAVYGPGRHSIALAPRARLRARLGVVKFHPMRSTRRSLSATGTGFVGR